MNILLGAELSSTDMANLTGAVQLRPHTRDDAVHRCLLNLRFHSLAAGEAVLRLTCQGSERLKFENVDAAVDSDGVAARQGGLQTRGRTRYRQSDP